MNEHSLDCALPEDHQLPKDFAPSYIRFLSDRILFICSWCGSRFEDEEIGVNQKRYQMRDYRVRKLRSWK